MIARAWWCHEDTGAVVAWRAVAGEGQIVGGIDMPSPETFAHWRRPKDGHVEIRSSSGERFIVTVWGADEPSGWEAEPINFSDLPPARPGSRFTVSCRSCPGVSRRSCCKHDPARALDRWKATDPRAQGFRGRRVREFFNRYLRRERGAEGTP